MNLNDAYDYYDELDDLDDLDLELDPAGSRPTPGRQARKRESKKVESDARLYSRALELSREFRFTYKAARFEEAWLLDSLNEIAEQQWISDVLRKIKAGKEASVYLCRAGAAIPNAELVAAKVYRPRTMRNLRNDGLYRQGRADLDDEGRALLDDGKLHAIQKKTDFGRELLHQSWMAYEFTALQTLHAAGADVPTPHVLAHNATLMEYVGSLDQAAPALNEIALDHTEATRLFERALRNIEILLAHDRIHGDLSAYNILYWEGDIALIDFPQVVSPRKNRSAFRIFERDVQRVCEYFGSQGVPADPRLLTNELWTASGHRVPGNGEEH